MGDIAKHLADEPVPFLIFGKETTIIEPTAGI